MRIFSVVVQPKRWGRSLSELANLLAPVTGSPPAALEKLLNRGPVTVETDLTPASAHQLCARLEALGIPAEIDGDEPELARTIADNPDIDQMLAQMGVSTIEVADDSELAEDVNRRLGDARPNTETPDAGRAEDEPRNAKTLLGGFQTLDPEVQSVLAAARGGDRVLPEPPKSTEQAAPGAIETPETRPKSGDDENPWGELFPGIGNSREARSQRQPEPVTQPTLEATNLDSILEEDSADARPSSAVDDVISGEFEPGAVDVEGGNAFEEEFAPPDRERSIEAARLSRAFLDRSGKPPYAPDGFDPRPDHSPAVAAILSAIAPGAGQVFNGDSDDALDYGWKSFMLFPWYQSVRQAHQKGERIRTHWAPRPESGAFVASLKYMVAWWVCFASVLFMLSWFSTAIYDAVTRPDVPETSAQDVRRALDDANLYVLQARVDSLDAVAAYRDSKPEQKFTMTPEERAERLFRIGYVECQSGDYRTCESTMKKVTSLDRTNRHAFKLQTWASMQQRTRKKRPMPDVGVIESLNDLELQEMQELEQQPAPE